MDLPLPNVRRHFIPWDGPLLPQIVAWLTRDWNEDGPLDLSGILAVVPTHQAGRRLRESLAVRAAASGWAVLSPRVITPDALLTPPRGMKAAPALTSIIAWSAVLLELDFDRFRDLFPLDPPARNFGWATRLGQQFAGLQATLAESGLRLADIPAAIQQGGGEALGELERWRQLAVLEGRYDAELAAIGLRDAQAAKIAAADEPALSSGMERMVILATPDPLPLSLRAIAAVARSLPVDIAIFAPDAEAAAFDLWGRPIAEAWAGRELVLPDFDRRVHLQADPLAQAEAVAGWAAGYRESPGIFAVGVADSDLISPLEAALGRRSMAAFDPAGKFRRADGLYALLVSLADLANEPSYSAVEALGRCPDFIAHLQTRLGASFSAARWLDGLDRLRARHLPPDLAAARAQSGENPDVAPGLAAMAELREILGAGSFVEGAAGGLARLFAGRKLQLGAAADRALEESAADWMEVLRDCAAAGGARLAREEWWDLALRLFGDRRRTGEKPPGAVELQGWLELLWEDAPHLAVAGCNDGRMPAAVEGDPFLPQSLCARLGLKTNEARLGRDSYLLQALAHSRERSGRLDLTFGRVSSAGDPLRPSRLLLRCPDADLPARIARLFRAPEAGKSHLAWTRAWRLAPPAAAAPERVGVTSLRAWLECPFRFYLRHVLKMEAVDAEKNELDPSDFGTLCHGAFEALGRDPGLRDCLDPRTLQEFLLAELDRLARRRFGADWSLPLVIQLESARQRLRRAAEIEAEERAAGWRIECVERAISLDIAGLQVNARVDRIDRHLHTGAVRVLDYKTADTAREPAAAHFRPQRSGETPPAAALFDWEGRPQVWSDLQLPLYRAALAADYPEIARCGYFNLPKAAASSRLSWWDPYPPDLQAAAMACAQRVCSAIRAGEFWPPNEGVRPESDPFAELFHHGVADSVQRGGAA